jgi:electron transfer flavoprotein alpha subunit
VAIIVTREGRIPLWADEAVTDAGGRAVVVGHGAEEAAGALTSAHDVRWCDTGPGFRPAALAASLAPLLEAVHLIFLPASADGRDLAPRLAAILDRPLLGRIFSADVIEPPGPPAQVGPGDGPSMGVRAVVARIDDKVMVPIEVTGPAIVTLARSNQAGPHGATPASATLTRFDLAMESPAADAGLGGPTSADPDLVALLAPDLKTMDLTDATRVMAGGAGLVTGLDDAHATTAFTLLTGVAAALGGSAGATRVATDAGWTTYERQIGTTGITVNPDLYIALGISGATQHTGGLGAPRHVISVNLDPSCPMTALADLGVVADAGGLLVELAHRLGVDVPDELRRKTLEHSSTGGPAGGSSD